MMQDQIRDDAGADRDQKEVAIVAAYPVIATPRPAQVRATPVIDNVGPTTVLDRHIAAPAIPAFVATAVIHAVAITITITITVAVMAIGMTATIPMAPIIVVMVVAPVVAAIIPAVIAVVIAAIIVTVPMIVLALIRALVTLPYRLGHNGCAR